MKLKVFQVAVLQDPEAAIFSGTPMKSFQFWLSIAGPVLMSAAPAMAGQSAHQLLEHAQGASEHAHVLAETTDHSFDALNRLLDQAHDMVEEALDLAKAGNTAAGADEMEDAILTLEAAHELSEAIAMGATSTHRFAEEAHMLVEKAVKANAAALAANRNDVHLKAEAEELAIADKQAGHADEEAEIAEKATAKAHDATERALKAARTAKGASGSTLVAAINAAHEAIESADTITWAAEHTVHDIDNSAEKAHEAIDSAHNHSQTVELIQMGESQK